MAWTFDAPLSTLSDTPTVEQAEKLWESESLGGLTEDNNPVPRLVVWLVALTVLTAFAVTFPLWGQRPTAALYAPYVNSMNKPEVLAAKDDTEAMRKIVAMNMGVGNNDAQLARHPLPWISRWKKNGTLCTHIQGMNRKLRRPSKNG